MTRVPVGLALRDRLGENGVRDLQDYIDEHREAWRTDMVNAVSERLDHRINQCATRDEMTKGFAAIGARIDAAKVELLQWSFVFWIGHVATIAVLLAYMLK